LGHKPISRYGREFKEPPPAIQRPQKTPSQNKVETEFQGVKSIFDKIERKI